MELITGFIDVFIHLDRYLDMIIKYFGIWTYLIVFLVIFCETGLVVTPFLPGDSFIFALGTIAALGSLEIGLLLIVLIVAAITGDSANYTVGKFFGPRVFCREDGRFFKKEHLDKTHRFYEKYGGKTIFLARFIPIIRTFAPFVAGICCMNYGRFLFYNISGGVAWIAFFALGGYYFGNIPTIKHNFTLVILTIIVISILPGIIEFFRQRTTS